MPIADAVEDLGRVLDEVAHVGEAVRDLSRRLVRGHAGALLDQVPFLERPDHRAVPLERREAPLSARGGAFRRVADLGRGPGVVLEDRALARGPARSAHRPNDGVDHGHDDQDDDDDREDRRDGAEPGSVPEDRRQHVRDPLLDPLNERRAVLLVGGLRELVGGPPARGVRVWG